MTSRVTFGSSSASGGWSHSWVTAVTSSPTPRANSISVADGTSDTIRIPVRGYERDPGTMCPVA